MWVIVQVDILCLFRVYYCLLVMEYGCVWVVYFGVGVMVVCVWCWYIYGKDQCGVVCCFCMFKCVVYKVLVMQYIKLELYWVLNGWCNFFYWIDGDGGKGEWNVFCVCGGGGLYFVVMGVYVVQVYWC